MSFTTQAMLASWSVPPWASFGLAITLLIYFRGWRRIRSTRPELFPAWRLACFAGGLLSLWFAIASPLDSFGNLLLTAHMAQHLVLMSVAPPLILLGAPQVPLLRGLPRVFVRETLGPFFRIKWLRSLAALLTAPAFAWIIFNAAFLAWHLPYFYELALRSNGWHELEHASFFLTSLLFWFVVIQPWPATSRHSRWIVLPFLVTADAVNTAFSAFLCFCGSLIYPSYAQAPRIFALSALDDQIAAGAFMWVIGSVAFLIPAAIITIKLLSPAAHRLVVPGARPAVRKRPIARPSPPSHQPFDLLRMRVIGPLLRSRYGRQSLQLLTLAVAVAIIADGLFGHPMSAMNLAGVIPWNYARALVVLGLLFGANFFCMACPFTLPREIGKRLGLATRAWPRPLRNKWLSAGLLVAFFWSFEVFSVWDHPARTAWLLVAYFAGAFFVDTLFRGASFCKYVCPVGQFNLVSSLISPLNVEVRSQSTCSTCHTRDCIAGNQRQRGCELFLFLPQKSGNLDCTLCMDCVKACPAENIGILAGSPAADLLRDPIRSSIGRLSSRYDVAAVALLIVTSAFANAAVMISPVDNLVQRLRSDISGMPLERLSSVALAILLPVLVFVLIAAAAAPVRRRAETGSHELITRFILALLPLGLSMWAAHLLFHLIEGWYSIIPALHEVAADLGRGSRTAMFATSGALFQPDTLLTLQLLLLDGGFLLSLYIGWRIVKQIVPESSRRPGFSFIPWAAVAAMLYAVGFWILLQPMQMRNMIQM